MRKVPVYNIEAFDSLSDGFYVNTLKEHLLTHHIVKEPHRHDFYLCVLFTKGKGTHEIDFRTYEIKPGSVFFLRPGQMHDWKMSGDTDGFIFFHSEEFYNLQFNNRKVKDHPFYFSSYNTPVLYCPTKQLEGVVELIRIMQQEYQLRKRGKAAKLASLLDIVYIDLTRLYYPSASRSGNTSYMSKLNMLEELIDTNYREIKAPAEYASLMNLSGKHLNRIVKTTLGKTVSEMIADRVILEAKRILVHSDLTISQIADELGYEDHSYFNRLFKKHTGLTPKSFLQEYK
jgi:AraC family transcriptional regulator, transcriptional activator of pobA